MYEQLNFLPALLDLDPVMVESNYPFVRFADNGVLCLEIPRSGSLISVT